MTAKEAPESSIDLSVIIVNYNVSHYLEQCLKSVFQALEGLKGEVFVVDNNSQDDSLAMLDEKFGNRIHLIANSDNPGFSKANNQALRKAKGTYTLLLNPDTLVGEDTFHTCKDFMDSQENAGALGVYMLDGRGEFLPESKRALPTPWVSFYKIFGLSSLFPHNPTFGKYHLSYLDKNQNHAIDILSGAFMFMRKSALDEIGFLDERFFMYGEDIDLSYRFLQAGYQNYYLSDTQILHYKGESTKKGSLNYVKVFYQAMLLFADKHFSGRLKKGFEWGIRMAVYLRAFLAILRRVLQKVGFPVIEWGLIWGILYGVQAYWEHYVKYIEGQAGAYPWIFERVYLPSYALVFIIFLALSGAYKKPYRIKPIFLGPFWAFIFIATCTYLFPFILNFSRAIVGLSAIFGSLMAFAIRGFINWRQKGHFFFEVPKTQAILIGHPQELERVWKLLHQDLSYESKIIGQIPHPVVSPTECPPNSPRNLGTLDELHNLSKVYEVDEWIFCLKGFSHTEFLTLLRSTGPFEILCRTVPADADFLLSPKSTLTGSRWDTGTSPLWTKSNLRNKRILDFALSFFFLLGFPLFSFFFNSPTKAGKALIQILLGKRHWVGYASEPGNLPPIKPSYLHLSYRLAPKHRKALPQYDRYYAQNYSLALDLEIIQKGWREIGKE